MYGERGDGWEFALHVELIQIIDPVCPTNGRMDSNDPYSSGQTHE